MNLLDFVILVFASYRLTRLIVFDTITDWLRRPFHEYEEQELSDGEIETVIHIKGTGIRAFIGELLSCYWCTGFWSSVIILLIFLYLPSLEIILYVLAISGAASMLFEITEK
ncbi:DUF1360 domain-containing protein [Bacillaceae bacterium S4-13-58]